MGSPQIKKMVHHRFDYHGIFQNENSTKQVVMSLRKILVRPEMRAVTVARFTKVNNVHQHHLINVSLSHPIPCVTGHKRWGHKSPLLATSAELWRTKQRINTEAGYDIDKLLARVRSEQKFYSTPHDFKTPLTASSH